MAVSANRGASPPPTSAVNPGWHTLAMDAVCACLNTQPSGLTADEAARRLRELGPNELQAPEKISTTALLLAQFKNVLIVILLVAAALSAALGHGVEALAITVIILFAVVLGFFQEYRAERAIEALRRMAAPTATALRDDEETELPAAELVPGDVIMLSTGDRVPADVRLLVAVNLQTEEAALTGESMPVSKHTQPLPEVKLTLGDRKNMAYAGTVVSHGRGQAVVVATGMQTEFGQIARLLETVSSGKTPLEINLDRVGRSLARVALVVVALIVALGLLRGQPWLEMLIFGIALAVAVVPEALPAVVTISLAIGVQRLVRRQALMRRLAAVETLGSTSVICTDKTGTLTKDEMTVRQLYVGGQRLSVSGAGYQPTGEFQRDGHAVEVETPLRQLLEVAALACDAMLVHEEADDSWRIHGDPTEGALVVAAAKAGLHKAELDQRYPRVAEIPFTAESKRMITLHTGDEYGLLCVKGAPEVVLATCQQQRTAGAEAVPLDAKERAAILAEAQQMADAALRVLAIAWMPAATLEAAEQGLIFLGLVGMIDPPRPEAKAAIQTCRHAGIKVVMITGDHPATALAVARELGLLRQGRVLTGTELEHMSAEEFARVVDEIEVYARVSPAHKLRVVTALQDRGQVVAMTGDGVNDAPALKKSDIGIAMGITGTDVSKEAAAMTLIDDNFASIVAAVEEGRGIFSNIKKYLMYLLSSNVGEIGLMAAAVLLGYPLPLSAVQILYVNLATDGLPALALAVDPPETDLMQRAPRNPQRGIFTTPVVVLLMLGGIWSAVVNLTLFAWALNAGHGLDHAMTMTFISLVLIQFFKAYNFRSDRNSVLHHPFANKWLNRAILWELTLLSLIIYLPGFQRAFGTVVPSPDEWAMAILAALTVVPVLELGKWVIRRGWLGALDR